MHLLRRFMVPFTSASLGFLLGHVSAPRTLAPSLAAGPSAPARPPGTSHAGPSTQDLQHPGPEQLEPLPASNPARPPAAKPPRSPSTPAPWAAPRAPSTPLPPSSARDPEPPRPARPTLPTPSLLSAFRFLGPGSHGGLLLSRVRPGSLPDAIGLRSYDELVSINGFRVSDPEQALLAYARLRQAERLTLELHRNGGSTQIVYFIR